MTVRLLDSAAVFSLLDTHVWVCGDWHGNVSHVQRLLPAMRRAEPTAATILHLGDWWMDPKPVDYWARTAGIERILVTLGNHEPWSTYTSLMDQAPGQAVRVSEVTWLLPRPFRFTIADRTFLSLGGATSIDRIWRTESVDWWSDETITEAQVQAAIFGGTADVMLTHESPDATPVEDVRRVLEAPPAGVPWLAMSESAASRHRIDRVRRAVSPDLLMHGHMHISGSGQDGKGRRVVSFDRDGSERNAGLLSLKDLSLSWLDGF